jgi:Protein of unknown function (DUF3592)
MLENRCWPIAEGQIESSAVARRTDDEDKTMYSAHIRYSYAVGDRRYEADTVWFGGDYSSTSFGAHNATVQRYPVGAKVTVHYDPARPEVAVLEPGVFFSSYAVFAFGVGLLGIGALVVLNLVRRLALQRGSRLRRYAESGLDQGGRLSQDHPKEHLD